MDITNMTIKAVGDWELDVLAIPYGLDKDEQTFDSNTDFMLDDFDSPVVIHQHGVEDGARGIDNVPVVIGKVLKIIKKADGVHVRVLLDKTKEIAKKIMEAARKGTAVASSGTVGHLARIVSKGKTLIYDKGIRGRISVWPFAELSLWDSVGNLAPASPYALAVPALKAVYEQAGISLPEFDEKSENDEREAEEKAARIAKKNLQKQARKQLGLH